jgi:hypothetical protein
LRILSHLELIQIQQILICKWQEQHPEREQYLARTVKGNQDIIKQIPGRKGTKLERVTIGF